jgi:hypothetical protein
MKEGMQRLLMFAMAQNIMNIKTKSLFKIQYNDTSTEIEKLKKKGKI